MIDLVTQLLLEALAEDAREGGRFDFDGWGNFFHEEWKKNPEAVTDAWTEYNRLKGNPDDRL